jgi:hypothetical protein
LSAEKTRWIQSPAVLRQALTSADHAMNMEAMLLKKHPYLPQHQSRAKLLFWLAALFLTAATCVTPALAQDGGSVQQLTGAMEQDRGHLYLLPGLNRGDTLYVYMTGTSGNLDAFVALLDAQVDAAAVSAEFWGQVDRAVAEGRDPLQDLPDILAGLALAWDDEYVVPADGDLMLLVTSSPARDTFGAYSVSVGLNAPVVLTGNAPSTGAEIAILDEESTRVGVYVQELTGSLSPEEPEDRFTLRTLGQGDTFFAWVETTSGDLAPLLVLHDYGEKPVRSGNLSGEESQASLFYDSAEDASNYTLSVSNDSYATGQTAGDYRLLVGINAPDVLLGEAEITDRPVVLEPIDVRVGVKLQQITNVDQISENFGAVANLQMEWQDPDLAFNPDECQCSVRTFAGDEFAKYVSSKGAFWPEFTFLNQQGNRWIQNRNGVVWPDGRAWYLERFTTDFQAPDFDFTQFPFDTQQLYIRLASVYPEQFYVYSDPDELSGLGEKLGEEEWTVVESSTETGIEETRAWYALGFRVRRHLSFYTFRIFVPIVLIIAVSYFTFFLKDYGKRVDVASANLLVFVAFNFTVSGELPRLGYLTFMDAILVGTFVITAVVVAFNVFLKRLEVVGKAELAHRIDAYSIWVYPLAYAIGGALVVFWFLL